MYQLQKVKEVVVSVKHIQTWLQVFCDYGGWTLLERGAVHPSLLQQYHLSANVSASQALIGFMDQDFGQIRFIEFHDVQQSLMRPAAKIWDTGGIADIDIRTADINSVYQEMTDMGWHAVYPPNPMPAPPFILDELLMQGPDGVLLALIQRYHPPLVLPENKQLASHIYLSAMTVQNMHRAIDFFVHQLGFTELDTLSLQFSANAPNNFGLPKNFSDKFSGVLTMFSPDGTRDTMLEAIHFSGLEGEDFSTACQPPNRGILSYRIGVKGLFEYVQALQQKGVPFFAEPTELHFGMLDRAYLHCMVISPEGVLVEFFEA